MMLVSENDLWLEEEEPEFQLMALFKKLILKIIRGVFLMVVFSIILGLKTRS